MKARVMRSEGGGVAAAARQTAEGRTIIGPRAAAAADWRKRRRVGFMVGLRAMGMKLRSWSIRGRRRDAKRAEFWLRFAPARDVGQNGTWLRFARAVRWGALAGVGALWRIWLGEIGREDDEGRPLPVRVWEGNGLDFRCTEAPRFVWLDFI